MCVCVCVCVCLWVGGGGGGWGGVCVGGCVWRVYVCDFVQRVSKGFSEPNKTSESFILKELCIIGEHNERKRVSFTTISRKSVLLPMLTNHSLVWATIFV